MAGSHTGQPPSWLARERNPDIVRACDWWTIHWSPSRVNPELLFSRDGTQCLVGKSYVQAFEPLGMRKPLLFVTSELVRSLDYEIHGVVKPRIVFVRNYESSKCRPGR